MRLPELEGGENVAVSGPLRGPSGGWHASPRPHEAYGLCALGLPQVKAVGLGVVFDHPSVCHWGRLRRLGWGDAYPPVNQAPSLTLGFLIYWGLLKGPPCGRLSPTFLTRYSQGRPAGVYDRCWEGE